MPEHAANQLLIVKASEHSGADVARHCAASEWAAQARVLKRDGRASVLAGSSPAGPVVVKSMMLDRPLDGLKRWLGKTRLLRQWRGGEILGRHGFAVARPLALWRTCDDRGSFIESLAMEMLPGKTVLQHLAARDLPPEAELALAWSLGQQAARLARLRLVNRDHKPSNLLAQPQSDGRARVVAILDTVAIRRSTPRASLVHMLFELMVEPIGCGVEVPIIFRLTALRAATQAMEWPPSEARRLWREVRRRLIAHGDPTPKIYPLSST